jgi:hypothetical protein
LIWELSWVYWSSHVIWVSIRPVIGRIFIRRLSISAFLFLSFIRFLRSKIRIIHRRWRIHIRIVIILHVFRFLIIRILRLFTNLLSLRMFIVLILTIFRCFSIRIIRWHHIRHRVRIWIVRNRPILAFFSFFIIRAF